MSVVVYGSTGYTGKLVCAELAARGVPFVAAGRSAEKLRAVAPGAREVRRAALDDPAALRAAFNGATVVVNCAGPFARTGAPVLEAAIAAGAHYLDTTGEQPWMRDVFERFDGPARAAGVAVVPAMGFDFVPGDLLCHLVGAPAAPLRELVVAYHVEGFGMTRGTLRSSLGVVAADTGPATRGWFAFPEPVGRRRVSGYLGGEDVTVPRHVDTARMVSRISTETIAPGPLGAVLPALLPGIKALLRSPLAAPLDAAIGRLPEGPPEDERRAVRWTVAAVAHAEDGATACGHVTGPDIYGLTAQTIAEGAQRLLADGPRADGGALAPAQAFDARSLLRALEPFGVVTRIP